MSVYGVIEGLLAVQRYRRLRYKHVNRPSTHFSLFSVFMGVHVVVWVLGVLMMVVLIVVLLCRAAWQGGRGRCPSCDVPLCITHCKSGRMCSAEATRQCLKLKTRATMATMYFFYSAARNRKSTKQISSPFSRISPQQNKTHNTPDYTDISIAIVLCGLYPLMTKSSAFHPSMLPPAGRAISSVGNARGSRSSCVRSASTWLR